RLDERNLPRARLQFAALQWVREGRDWSGSRAVLLTHLPPPHIRVRNTLNFCRPAEERGQSSYVPEAEVLGTPCYCPQCRFRNRSNTAATPFGSSRATK